MLAVLAKFKNHSQTIERKLNELINEPNYLDDLASDRMHSLIIRGVFLIPQHSKTNINDAGQDNLGVNRENTTATQVVNTLKTLANLFEERERLHDKLTEIFEELNPNLKFPSFMDQAGAEELMHLMNLMDDEELIFDPESPDFSGLLQEISNLEVNIDDEILRNRKYHELTLPYMVEIRKKLQIFLQQRQKNVSA